MNLIVAVDNNWAIGYKNDLLISIPDTRVTPCRMPIYFTRFAPFCQALMQIFLFSVR